VTKGVAAFLISEQMLTFDKIRSTVLSEFPEIREWACRKYGEDFDIDEDAPGHYPLFEDVVRPFLFDLLETGADSRLKHLFDFLEEMASSTDRDIRDLLGIVFLEGLVLEPDRLRFARKYMGSQMKELVIQEAQRLGKL
jgi:hypothetical protein